jgi:hypothetical protein
MIDLSDICRPGSLADAYLRNALAKGHSNPTVPDELRAKRLVMAAFHGLAARLGAEGWRDKLIKAAMVEVAGGGADG